MPVSDRTETADIWYVTKNNKVTVGFMSDFLKKMTDCWHISPVESPLMVLEMGDELLSIMSPSKGLIESFNTKAQNFPEQLTEDDVICIINENGVKPKPAPRAPQAAPVNPFLRNGVAGGNGISLFGGHPQMTWEESTPQTVQIREFIPPSPPTRPPRPSLGNVMRTHIPQGGELLGRGGPAPDASPSVNSSMQRILDQIAEQEARRADRITNPESEF